MKVSNNHAGFSYILSGDGEVVGGGKMSDQEETVEEEGGKSDVG